MARLCGSAVQQKSDSERAATVRSGFGRAPMTPGPEPSAPLNASTASLRRSRPLWSVRVLLIGLVLSCIVPGLAGVGVLFYRM
jgi:hypothetical protein